MRGEGLLLGVMLDRPASLPRATRRPWTAGSSSTRPAPDAIRLAPPLIVSDREVDAFLDRFPAALSEVLDEALTTV